jgi:hypothetical protein
MNNSVKVALGAVFAVAIAMYANTLIAGVAHGGFWF